MTKDHAMALLKADINYCEREIERLGGEPAPNQFRGLWKSYRNALKDALSIVEQINES